MILILGAVRTGSTYLYQLVCNLWKVNYFANDGQIRNTDETPIPYVSAYGKTKEPHEPSEASYIFTKWFGSGREVKPEYRQEMIDTLTIHRPMVIKNIWNVYRVKEWLSYFPDTQFIWIRRNVEDAAKSDLKARAVTGNGLNCAFRNFSSVDLSDYPDRIQVTRQQIEINKTIGESLKGENYIQIHYEELCKTPSLEIVRLKDFLRAEWRGRDLSIGV